MTYHLGSNQSEQARLFEQSERYGDTRDIKFESTDRVCELGCGPFSNAWIAQQLTSGNYIGVDSSVEQIQTAEKRAEELKLSNSKFLVASASETGLPDASFETVFIRFLLIHLSDPRAALREALRIVRPGGRIVVVEAHVPSYYIRAHAPNLVKCFAARLEVGYGGGKGSPNIALDLYPFLKEEGAVDVKIRQHPIIVTGEEHERAAWFLSNFLRLTQPTMDEAIRRGLISAAEWESAKQEATVVPPNMLLFQSMWIAEGQRSI